MSVDYTIPNEIKNINEMIIEILPTPDQEKFQFPHINPEDKAYNLTYMSTDGVKYDRETIPEQIVHQVLLYRLQNYQSVPIFRIRTLQTLREFIEPIKDNPFRDDIRFTYLGG